MCCSTCLTCCYGYLSCYCLTGYHGNHENGHFWSNFAPATLGNGRNLQKNASIEAIQIINQIAKFQRKRSICSWDIASRSHFFHIFLGLDKEKIRKKSCCHGNANLCAGSFLKIAVVKRVGIISLTAKFHFNRSICFCVIQKWYYIPQKFQTKNNILPYNFQLLWSIIIFFNCCYFRALVFASPCQM